MVGLFLSAGIPVIAALPLAYYRLRYMNQIEAKNKELEELNQLKDRLISTISHDIRSPIANTVGVIDLIIEDGLSKEEVMDVSLEAKNKFIHLLDFIDNVLLWAKNQIKGVWGLDEVNLDAVVNVSLGIIADEACRKQVDVFYDSTEELSVYGNYDAMVLSLNNLIQNAVKFSCPKDAIHIKIEDKRDFVFIHVKDQGIGMSEEKINEVLNEKMVYSVEGTHSEPGFGLGLKMVKENLDKMNGVLQIERNKDQGMTISLGMPKYKKMVGK